MKLVENQCTVQNPVDAPIVRDVHRVNMSLFWHNPPVLTEFTYSTLPVALEGKKSTSLIVDDEDDIHEDIQ